jgi:hypothetical protein
VKSISIISRFILFLLITKTGEAQKTNNLADTFRYKSTIISSDTLYSINRKIRESTYQIITMYGFKDDTDISSSVDTFVVGKSEWGKIYNNQTIPFLSINKFANSKKIYEYLDREKKDRFYLEYSPIKKFSIDQKDLYLYMVRPMSGQGLVESLGETVYYIAFDFDKGLVYLNRSEIKVLEGYEKYIQYFKW